MYNDKGIFVMSSIYGVGGSGNSYQPSFEEQLREKDIDLEDISILYTTTQTEDKRSTFDKTYKNTPVEQAPQGAQFLNGLKDNKETLAKDLGLDSEQYDRLACVALALASQETGMGLEQGYVEENTGAGGNWRKFMKWVDVNIMGGASASSGLTQMKIYDFMNSNKLTQDQKNIMTKYGIDVDGVATNNLYAEPDKAAVATMVVLKSLIDNYSVYTDKMATEHSKLQFNDGLTEEERIEKGDDILMDVAQLYEMSDTQTRVQIRSQFKQWLLSTPGNKDKDYNEAEQLKKLNQLLANGEPPMQLQQSDLDYIRYTLTSPNRNLTTTEYCAYAWNKGTGDSGMQLDRILADQIGIILSNPEDFDYDQFTVNVSTLAEMYANQSVNEHGILLLNNAFNDEI